MTKKKTIQEKKPTKNQGCVFNTKRAWFLLIAEKESPKM